MSKPLKPDILINRYEARVGLFSIRDQAVKIDMYTPGEVMRQIMLWHLNDKSLALARNYKVAVIKIRHPEELIPESSSPDKDAMFGGRTSIQEYNPYIPIPEKTRFVVGHKPSGLPIFKTKEHLLKQQQLPDYVAHSLGELALRDGWRGEMDDFLPLLPGQPASLEEFQGRLRAGSSYEAMIDNPRSIPVDY